MKPKSQRKASRRGTPRLPRIGLRGLLIVVVLAAAAFGGYAATAHWLLSGPKLRSWINTHPESTLLDWDEAVSIWPGVVRLKNLRIRGSDANVEWEIRLSEARADFSLPALLARTFRVERVAGSGLKFRLRQKLDPKDPSRPPPDALPPIEGFADPPLRKPAPAPEPTAEGRPWTVEVGGIAIDRFDEIWFDAYRFDGLARLRGRFLLEPGLRARVGPAAIDFLEGPLGVGGRPLVAGLEGRIRASIAEWDPRRVRGDAVWRNLDAQIDLHGPVPGLDFVNYYLRREREPRFAAGKGALSIAGSVARGIASGRVHLASNDARVRRPGVELTGDVRAELRVPRWELEASAIDLSGSSLQLSDVSAAGAGDTRGWWGKFDLAPAHVRQGLDATVALECRDARPLFAALGAELPKWTRGLLTLEGLKATADVALAPARTRVHALEARGGEFHILGEYERRSGRERGVFLVESRLLRVGVQAHDGGATVHLLAVRSWYEQESAAIAQTSRGDSGAGGK